MADRLTAFGDAYADALRSFIKRPGEAELADAYELGRRAFSDGFGVLEMATVHARAIALVLDCGGDEERRLRLDAVDRFFTETLSPFEMAHRAFQDANAILHRLNNVLEGQAKRIAYALHDEAAQIVATMHLALADAASRPPDEVPKAIHKARLLLDQMGDRLRSLSHELRPPILDDLGLVPALEFLADGVSKRWGLAVTVEASTGHTLPPMVETTLYRITQEALTNVGKHANATRAEVRLLHAPHRITCSVRDDGIGLDTRRPTPRKRGLGLLEIEERVAALGGVLRVEPNHAFDRGTDLTVEIPLER